MRIEYQATLLNGHHAFLIRRIYSGESSIERKTNETNIKLRLWIDGEGKAIIETGCSVYDSYARFVHQAWHNLT